MHHVDGKEKRKRESAAICLRLADLMRNGQVMPVLNYFSASFSTARSLSLSSLESAVTPSDRWHGCFLIDRAEPDPDWSAVFVVFFFSSSGREGCNILRAAVKQIFPGSGVRPGASSCLFMHQTADCSRLNFLDVRAKWLLIHRRVCYLYVHWSVNVSGGQRTRQTCLPARIFPCRCRSNPAFWNVLTCIGVNGQSGRLEKGHDPPSWYSYYSINEAKLKT